jgi:hypothetical protein
VDDRVGDQELMLTSVHQLVTREKDDRDRRVMQAITLLGSQGVLDELNPSLADEDARNDDNNNDGL